MHKHPGISKTRIPEGGEGGGGRAAPWARRERTALLGAAALGWAAQSGEPCRTEAGRSTPFLRLIDPLAQRNFSQRMGGPVGSLPGGPPGELEEPRGENRSILNYNVFGPHQVALGSIPGSGRSPGEGNGYPLLYSCLENPMDGGA